MMKEPKRKSTTAKVIKAKTPKQMAKRLAQSHAVSSAYTQLLGYGQVKAPDLGMSNLILCSAEMVLGWALGKTEDGNDTFGRSLAECAATVAKVHGSACDCAACLVHREIAAASVEG